MAYDPFHTAAPTGEHDRSDYFACQCDACGCDRDPGRAQVCRDCRAGEHQPCASDCGGKPPHIR